MRQITIFLSILVLSLILVSANTHTSGRPIGVPNIGETLNVAFDELAESFERLNINFAPFTSFLQQIGPSITYIYFWLIIFIIIFAIFDSMGPFHNQLVTLLVSIGAAGLAIIALPEDFLHYLIPLYKSMFFSLFLIIFIAGVMYGTLRVKSLLVARMIWILIFLYVFSGLLLTGIPALDSGNYAQVSIYVILCIAILVFIFAMKPIRLWLYHGDLNEKASIMKQQSILEAAIAKKNKEEAEALGDAARKR